MDRELFATGDIVAVRGHTGLWTLIEDDSFRVVVEQKFSLCEADSTFDSTLSTTLVVEGGDVSFTKLVVAGHTGPVLNPWPMPVVNPDVYNNSVESIIIEATGNDSRGFWDPSAYFNRWVPLRALGGNSILIRPPPAGHRAAPLVLFPRIDRLGLELWFHSRWYGESMQMTEVDGLDLCPAGQFWPKCIWCNKFHLPFDGAGAHRASNSHTRFRSNYMDSIHREEPGSERRRQLLDEMKKSTEAWCGPVANIAHMVVHDPPSFAKWQ